METLQIRLLGGFRLLYNEHPIGMVHQLRLQSLLAYLVLHQDLPQARQHLAFLFWPDSSETQARANLRKALYDLRKLLPNLEHFLQINDQFLQWRNSTATTLDVALFADSLTQANQQEVARSALEQAIDLYVGDLLPACYDDWLLHERERLRQLYIKALEQLIGILEQQREIPLALDYAQRLLHFDSLHESTYRLLMRLHVLNGDRATALRIYHTCVTLLQQELGVEPSEETQQVYLRLLNVPTDLAAQPNSTSSTARGMLKLVGRQPEWNTLQTAWRTAAAGAAHCVLIAGEAGIGKTRLAEELLQWVDRQGYATARTRSYAAEGRLAYAPISDWLRSDAIRARLPEMEQVWLVEVARLLPELLVERPDLFPPASLTDSWQRQRFREALARAILRVRQPLLLVIDDLQWCDSETLEWLHYLLRLAAFEPLLVVGTLRSEEVGGDHALTTLMMNLRQSSQLVDIELGSLTGAETAALASQIAGDALSHDQADALYAQTEGHPLFVVEMLRANEKKGTISVDASTPASLSLPPKVQAVIQSRLAQLSPSARELAGLAATVGRAFTLEVLAQASDGNEDSLVQGLDELWQRRLIREQGDTSYDFSHDRIREAAYAGVSSARRRLLHRRVGEALEATHTRHRDDVSAQLGNHWEQAGLPEKALVAYHQASAGAKRLYAYADSIHYAEKALAILNTLPPDTAHKRQEISLLTSMGDSLTVVKGFFVPELDQVYLRAQALCREIQNPALLFVVQGRMRTMLGQRGEWLAAHELSTLNLKLAEELQNPLYLRDAHFSLGAVLHNLGDLVQAITHLRRAVAIPVPPQVQDATSPPPSMSIPVSIPGRIAQTLWFLGYPDQAAASAAEGVASARAFNNPYYLVFSLYFQVQVYQMRREVQQTHACAQELADLATQYDFSHFKGSGEIYAAWCLAAEDDPEKGLALLHNGLIPVGPVGTRAKVPYFLSLLAEVCGKCDQPQEGLMVLAEAMAVAERTGYLCWNAELLRLRGKLLQMHGASMHEVEAQYVEALDIARRQSAKSLELRTAMSLCRLWQQLNKREEARILLAEIYGWFSEGFTTPDLIEAKALLEELS